MKVGDYVAKVENKWQQHNEWLEFPDEPPVLLGIVVEIIRRTSPQVALVLEPNGQITPWPKNKLKVMF
jgi:hypothetical protein